MALWKETPTPASSSQVVIPSAAPQLERLSAERNLSEAPIAVSPRRPVPRERGDGGESVIAANLSIEGKIEGSGNVRMAGRFKGDVRIDGNFSMEAGAHLTGQILAVVVVIGGELQGNIESAKRIDVLETGVIVGDVRAGSLTVAAGSRMRGHVEFGWEEEKALKFATAGAKDASGSGS